MTVSPLSPAESSPKPFAPTLVSALAPTLLFSAAFAFFSPLTSAAVAHPPGAPRPLSATAIAAGAQVTRQDGLEFVSIGAPGNPTWRGTGAPVNDYAIGRGSVSYAYRIGRYEVTSAQWVEFLNAGLDRPSNDTLPWIDTPAFWGGARTTPNNPNGFRWNVSAANAMLPANGIGWRTAAMYCNWLTNDKRTDRAAFLTGAYDVSTFGYTPFGTLTDQPTRSPTAKYWIPSLDEWIKAAHYDPNKSGTGQGGYWLFPITKDTPPAYAPPGVQAIGGQGLGQSSAGWESSTYPGFNPFAMPLGAYTNVMSPWGLFDTSGGTSEWTEEIILYSRLLGGSAIGLGPSDRLGNFPGDDPSSGSFRNGFRIATHIPAPGAAMALITMALLAAAPHRRRPAAPRGSHPS
jgi:sulfatase modifying factor 1